MCERDYENKKLVITNFFLQTLNSNFSLSANWAYVTYDQVKSRLSESKKQGTKQSQGPKLSIVIGLDSLDFSGIGILHLTPLL